MSMKNQLSFFILCFFGLSNCSTFVFAQTNPNPQSMPYTQDFGNNWFLYSGLPDGFAVWTASGAPRASNTSAAVSNPGADDAGFDSATVVKSPGKAYGYSGITGSGVAINNGELYIQTSGTSTGTDQLVLAINTTGYKDVTVSFDVEMINPQPKRSGFAFQFRVGTTGAFTTIDSSYWQNTSSRLQNQVDNFINLLLPSSADNQSFIQLRWATARDINPAGSGSCGFGFDNIIVSGNQYSGELYFRSAATGNWNSISTWESSADNITWSPATRTPSSSENTIVIRAPHTVSSAGISFLVVDQTTVDSGATLWNAYGTAFGINDGPGLIDLDINGTFVDSSNFSLVIPATASWRLGTNANLIKTTNTSSTIWQLRYFNGISNIPATSNWICRKPAGALIEPSISTTNGGPPYPQVYYGNLYIENYSGSWNPNNLCKFSGYINYPVIKGNFFVGGKGTGSVDFNNSNTHSSPVKVCGYVLIKPGSTLTVIGTGLEVQGDFTCNGIYTHAGSGSKLLFAGAIPQNVTGTGSISTWKLEFNKTFSNITVNNNMNVYGNLNLLNGIAFTYPSTKIIVQKGATATNASNLSFVNGPIQKKGDEAFIFPVGKGNDYQAAGMNTGSGALTTDAFTAEYFHDNPQSVYGNNVGPGINHISACEYWIITKDAGNAQKNITLTWDGNSCGVTNLSELRVARFNNSMWVNEGNTATAGSTSSGTITSAVTTGYGPFTLASTTIQNPLPLTLLYFTGDYTGKDVKLAWVTAAEINNLSFTVERSNDGKSFSDILTMPAAGNSTVLNNYSAKDPNPLIGISYYRLRQTDYDGKSSYSDIVPIRVIRESIELLSFSTSRPDSKIEFEINFPYSVSGKIDISDMSGRVLLATKYKSSPQQQQFSFDTGTMSGGIYYLRIYYDYDVIVKKFLY